MNISVEGAKAGSNIAVFNMQGKLVASGKAIFGNAAVSVPSKGLYMVRVGNKLSKVSVK
jgi:archaeosine-15-forming tRNA-guanine transglycosylase